MVHPSQASASLLHHLPATPRPLQRPALATPLYAQRPQAPNAGPEALSAGILVLNWHHLHSSETHQLTGALLPQPPTPRPWPLQLPRLEARDNFRFRWRKNSGCSRVRRSPGGGSSQFLEACRPGWAPRPGYFEKQDKTLFLM